MVFLNGEPFPVYGIDTQESRLNRVAWRLKTSPLFISVIPKDLVDIDEKTNIIAEDYLSLIKKTAEAGEVDFPTFYNQTKDKFTTPFEIVLYMWLKYSSQDESLQAVTDLEIESAFPIKANDIRKHDNYDQTQAIKAFLDEQTKAEEEMKNFSAIIPVDMDKIEVQKITFEVQFKINVDLVELFDRLKMSDELPYANNGPDRHKIYKNFKNLGENWELGDVNAIQFFVLNTRYPPLKFQEKFYSQGIIVLSQDNSGEAILAIETLVGIKNSLNELIDRVFRSLLIGKDMIIETRQQSVSSVVNIPKQRFNKYVLADIVAIDPFVSGLCYIDESAKVGRVRQGISFFYQPVGADEKVTIGLTESAVELKEYRRSSEMYPIDSRYIRVRINKAKNEEMTKEIAGFVGKIFRVYLNQHAKIVADYRKFIPDFIELEEKEAKLVARRGNRLQDLVPEVFIPGYARKCLRPPVIIDSIVSREAKVSPSDFLLNNVGEYKQAILFPRTSDEGTQHWYACEKSAYPGLRSNVLENADQYPYLPCCYPNPQTDKKNYKTYYLDYNIQDTATTFTHILKTPKFLLKGELGTIPSNLDTLFQSLMKDKVDFFRTGTPRSPASFLDAVGIAMGKTINKANITDEMLAVCRQSAFDYSIKKLRQILNSKDYISPTIFYRALEEYFGCYIYLFTRTETNRGAVIHPQHRHVFLRYLRENRPIVLILEHLGSESDAAQYPQSEIIIYTSAGKKFNTFDGDFANKIDQVFTQTVEWHSGLKIVNDIKLKDVIPSGSTGIIGQGIDSMGKTRTLKLKYKDQNFYIVTDPLPPLYVKEIGGYGNNPRELIDEYIREFGLEVKEVLSDRVIAIRNGYTLIFPYQVVTTSLLQKYNKNQRIARYLQEYSYFLYSLYAKENGFNPRNINSFLRDKTTVKLGYIYPIISRKFDLSSGYLSNGKLIVLNLEMAQRLGYSIELMMRRSPKRLMEYSKLEYIQDYYLDANDFQGDPDSVIFMTAEALKEWISQVMIEYPLLTVPTSTSDLFYLQLFDKVVLVQLAVSFENAVYISQVWNEKGYNSKSVLSNDELGYMYYIFETPSKITIRGDHSNKVLVWREGNELKYGAILVGNQ